MKHWLLLSLIFLTRTALSQPNLDSHSIDSSFSFLGGDTTGVTVSGIETMKKEIDLEVYWSFPGISLHHKQVETKKIGSIQLYYALLNIAFYENYSFNRDLVELPNRLSNELYLLHIKTIMRYFSTAIFKE